MSFSFWSSDEQLTAACRVYIVFYDSLIECVGFRCMKLLEECLVCLSHIFLVPGEGFDLRWVWILCGHSSNRLKISIKPTPDRQILILDPS